MCADLDKTRTKENYSCLLIKALLSDTSECRVALVSAQDGGTVPLSLDAGGAAAGTGSAP